MCNSTVILIPVKKHVKQYLLREFGVEPLRVHQNQFLGQTVKLVLEKEPYRILKPKAPTPMPGAKPAAKMAQVAIILPSSLKHYTISEQSLQELSKWFEKFFIQQLILFVKGAVAYDIPYGNAVNRFFLYYQFDADSCDVENLRKYWRDYMDNLHKENKKVQKQEAELVPA